MDDDRFEKLSEDYADHSSEIYQFIGFEYAEVQKSVITTALKLNLLSDTKILEIGVGDGETSKYFLPYYQNLICIDLNDQMLANAKKNYAIGV